MKRFFPTVVLPLALFCSLAYGGEKPWQTGKVKFAGFEGSRTFSNSWVAPGRVDSSSTTVGGSSMSSTTSSTTVRPPQTFTFRTEVDWFKYAIQTEDRVYICQERRSGRQRPALLLIDGDVRFYLDGDKLVLVDEANKTHKTVMVRMLQRRSEPKQ